MTIDGAAKQFKCFEACVCVGHSADSFGVLLFLVGFVFTFKLQFFIFLKESIAE